MSYAVMDEMDSFAARNRDYGHNDQDPNESEDARLEREEREGLSASATFPSAETE